MPENQTIDRHKRAREDQSEGLSAKKLRTGKPSSFTAHTTDFDVGVAVTVTSTSMPAPSHAFTLEVAAGTPKFMTTIYMKFPN